MSQTTEKYLIRYTNGNKANQVAAFDFSKSELSIGRDAASDILFDPDADLGVSRQHAKILKKADDCFVIVDNGSRNGTFVNGKKVTGQVLLQAGDEIRLGSQGPAFIFDLDPRPATMQKATQILQTPAATKTIDVSAVVTSKKPVKKFAYLMALPLLLILAGAFTLYKGNTQKNVISKVAGEGDLAIQIFPMQAMMPAAYKVYANPAALNGRYYFAKVVIDNKGQGDLQNVKVEYTVPGYIPWTTVSEIKHILPGGSVVATIYPQFPQKITEKTTESTERAQIRITYLSNGKPDKYEKNYQFQMLSRNDFLYTNVPANEISGPKDFEDNNDLSPVFITPQDPIVKYYTQQIQEKILAGETASVGQDMMEAIRFMAGVYEATRRTHMVYSGTGGAFVQTGDIQSVQQKVRLPREVITGNTGLCIEMSFLYASVFAAEGLEPVIFFKPGHAFPGIRFNGELLAIEPTAVGGEGIGGVASAQEAFNAGMKELKDFIQHVQQGDTRYTMVDVNDLIKKGVHQMELSDDAFLRTKVDKLAAQFVVGGPLIFNNQKQTVQNGQQVQQ